MDTMDKSGYWRLMKAINWNNWNKPRKKANVPRKTIVSLSSESPDVSEEREKRIKSLIDLDFDTECALNEFRTTQEEHFDEEGKSYRGNIISHSTMELMFKIINGFDNYAKSIRED